MHIGPTETQTKEDQIVAHSLHVEIVFALDALQVHRLQFVESCKNKMGVICDQYIREPVVHLTVLFLSSFRQIEIFNTTRETIKNDLTKKKNRFFFVSLLFVKRMLV